MTLDEYTAAAIFIFVIVFTFWYLLRMMYIVSRIQSSIVDVQDLLEAQLTKEETR